MSSQSISEEPKAPPETGLRTVSGLFTAKETGAALCLANLYMLPVWDELLDRNFDYFRDIPFQTWPIFGTAIAHLLLLAFLFWLLIAAVGRARSTVLRKAACFVLLGFFFLGLDTARATAEFYAGSSRLLGRTGIMIVGAILVCLVVYFVLKRERFVLRTMLLVLLFLLPLLPINLATVAWAVRSGSSLADFAPNRPLPPVAYSPSAPRFIWVVFDEWDHYLTFEHRPAGLELPELDRFRAEAFDADTAYSPAINTNEALPSLMSGRIVKQGERSGPSDMVLTFADTGNTALWSTLPNVFQRARPLGVNTAMIGYHHPYSRIVGRYVTESYSLSNVTLHQEPVYWRDTHGFRRLYLEVEESLIRIPMVMHYLHMFNQRRQKRAFRIAYIAVHDRALKLAARPDLGLLMIHLPIPHPPGIYDRGRRQVTTENHASYVDNLALLDVTLGELRKVMESQGQWDKSFVLLTSDHPLRAWEGEEYLVMIPSPKQPRIPFLLKLPGRQTHLSYEPPFNTVLTQELVLAALRGELREPGDVARWLDANRLRYPTTPIMQAPPPAAQAAAAH